MIRDHIIICGICHNLIDLIKPLRSKNFPKNILPIIVILSKDLPNKKLWNTIAYFENIYLVKGNAIEKSDLKRAGIKTAKYVILLAPSINEISNFTESQRIKNSEETVYNSDDEEENNDNSQKNNLSKEEEFLLDSQTILKYNQITKINKDIFCVVELINPKNVLFLNNKNRRNNDEYTFIQSGLSIDATASFASGEVYYSNIMDNIITQAYYNPSLLSVLKKLIVGDEMQSNLNNDKVMSKYTKVPSGSLYLIDLPLVLFKKGDEFNNGNYHTSFDKVYNTLLKKNIIVIGVYRYGSLNKKLEQEKETISLGNFNDTYFYYVVTAPEPDFVVNQKDQLFVIATEYPKPENFEEMVHENYSITKRNINLRDYNRNSNIKNFRINEIAQKMDEEMENKLVNFNLNLEKTKGLVDEIEVCINTITKESSMYINDSIKNKLNKIKNEK